MLLSSLQGAAVTSIKIENVLHEFSSLAGVREDVTDIVLNVKQIALRMEGEGPQRLQLSATGPAEVKAGDIAVSGDIVVMNPDLVICHLDEGASFNMELTANIGKGYVPAVANRPADAPIGLIPVDALFSPVRQVAYKVENARIGQELDYDKLNLTLETDGDGDAPRTRWLMPRASFRTSCSCSSTSRMPCRQPVPSTVAPPQPTKARRHQPDQPLPAQEGGRAGAARCVRPTASRTTTSSTSATWSRRPRPRCSARRTSAASRSTRSRKSSSSMGLRLGMDIPGWPPENIEEIAKKLEQELLG